MTLKTCPPSSREANKAGLMRRSAVAGIFLALLSLPAGLFAHGLPDSCRQVVVATADSWDANRGLLRRFEKSGKHWIAVGKAVPVLFGRKGLAWGLGVSGQGEPGRIKIEKDKRAPAGIFKLGKIYTHQATLPDGADYPYRTVTKWDAWVDDPSLPEYNRHVVVDPSSPPEWFPRQRMRHNDSAYEYLVEIRHNSDPPIAGRGSAIFFHIRRGPDRPSAGCTTMSRDDLVEMIRWLRAASNPHYVLLPMNEYKSRQQQWNLPPLS